MWRQPAARSLAALTFIVSTSPATAGADEVDDQIQEMATRAHADYLTGEYERAADLLMEAYRLRPVPKLLFNAAKTYEKAGITAKAAKYFRLFLSQSESDNPLVPKALRALAGLPGSLARPPPPDEAPGTSSPQSPTPRGRAIAAFGIAGAAAIAGSVFGWMALSIHSEFEEETAISDRLALRDSARRQAVLADISWGLAAAALVTGVVLWPSAPGGAGPDAGLSPTGAFLRATW
jgi:tetratricopeptide (TPR) repeat protein